MRAIFFTLLLISFFQTHANKKFVVLVASYNNESVVSKNLDSIFNQDYENFRVIYIDDNSTDTTLKKVEKYLEAHKQKKGKIEIVKNNINIGGLANYYYTINNRVQDEEIVVCLDGDDFFFDNCVLSYLNNVYEKKNIWLTYGQFVMLSNKCMGWNVKIPSRVVSRNDFRKFKYVPTHLRTFYAWLFKKIKKEDLLWHDGTFFKMAWDMAFMFPMLEMSGGKFAFIRKPTYIYNDLNPINDHKKNVALQRDLAEYIRKMPKYGKLVTE